ncbi:MAG TPA: hypothetical protein DD001_06640 [Microcoleaceae bacterium UBA10368]|jgi:Protein of unknown function (DUF1822).|nr:hypothetical protein [Microcoleaceae cyanobacterium UBA10368]HCV31575.1 hypothetical protein [Microcoleaceae cyanobacterium UBA9251]
MTYTSRPMFAVPLTSKALKLAKSFQEQYESPAKARQVYLNTLAVYAVDTYCQCLGIETDLEASDSLNPVMQTLMDVADIEITGIGKLECRPVLPTDENCYIPTDTWENRIGYVAVEIDESSREATLFGFYPTINPLEMMEQVSCESFQPLEALIDHLDRIESALFFFQSDEPVVVKVRERLTDEPLAEIITQLERIYRTYNKYERRYAGGEFLASYLPTTKGVAFRGSIPVADREEFDDSQQTELQDLAEELLEKLDEIWGDDNSDELVDSESSTNESSSVIQQFEQPAIVPISQSQSGLINLSEWLQNPEGSQYHWQPLELFLSNQEGNLIFRFASAPRSRSADAETPTRSVSKVKEIPLPGHPLVLIINCQLESDGRRDILVRLYPSTEEQTYLPEGAQLIILDESGEVFLEAQSRSADNWIQLEFRGEAGEPFSIKVVFGDLSVTDNFAI